MCLVIISHMCCPFCVIQGHNPEQSSLAPSARGRVKLERCTPCRWQSRALAFTSVAIPSIQRQYGAGLLYMSITFCTREREALDCSLCASTRVGSLAAMLLACNQFTKVSMEH